MPLDSGGLTAGPAAERVRCNRACAELGYLNGQAVFAASDFLVAREFEPYEPLPPGKAVCAMLTLDGLWATQLFRERRGLERMLRSYEQHAASYGDVPRGPGRTVVAKRTEADSFARS